MKKRRMVVALILGLVLVFGFYSLMAVAQGAPHKANKHLAPKAPVQSAVPQKIGKILALKLTPRQRTALGASSLIGVGIVGVLLAPWTQTQFYDIKRMISCAQR